MSRLLDPKIILAIKDLQLAARKTTIEGFMSGINKSSIKGPKDWNLASTAVTSRVMICGSLTGKPMPDPIVIISVNLKLKQV